MTNTSGSSKSSIKTPGTVSEIMTERLIVVNMGTPIREANELMLERRIRHLPVVDEMDDIVGILSKRDLVQSEKIQNMPVEYFMTSPVEFIHQNTPLKTAIYRMLEKKISSLMISDDNDDAVGIVTTDDLLGYLLELIESDPEGSGLLKRFDLSTIGSLAQRLSDAGI